eukprot:jgi/Botrbrau1/7116/Bobra.0165s0133.1
MGKHNGKSRTSGLPVGSALVNRAKKGLLGGQHSSGRHTTKDAPSMQSILETNDLSEMLSLADLAGRDFAAERHGAVLVANNEVHGPRQQATAEQRLAADQAMQHRLKLPRRPAWTRDMTAAEVEAGEKTAFLAWRRGLAQVEEQDHILLTPFEKNLEVWRQLWRVLERSHIVVQVVDARDPLFYRSEDLEQYARELHPSKESVLLLNKADLLPQEARLAWANYFDSLGVAHYFWSAKAASEETTPAGEPASQGAQEAPAGDHQKGRVWGLAELMHELERRAATAAEAGCSSDAQVAPASCDASTDVGAGRVVVGLTGYPNVGKSSTINALFGSKKTAVAATPGKTKHFQTLNITERLTVCDCPGLVLPRSASSKGDLVAAGVVPIDRLTDVREPAAVIAQRIPRALLESTYTMRLPHPAPHEDPNRPPTAAELLRAVAASRGWSVGGGLPDEARAGRLLLKDYTSGRLLHLEWPPGYRPPSNAVPTVVSSVVPMPVVAGAEPASALTGEGAPGSASLVDGSSRTVQPDRAMWLPEIGDEILLAQHTALAGRRQEGKPRRPDYKFQKKPPRTKGRQRAGGFEEGVHDGAALPIGRKGGLMRVSA